MKKLKTFNVKQGGFYQDISEFGDKEVYHLCLVDGDFNTDSLRYALIGLFGHNRYSNPTTDINQVFEGDREYFVQVTGNILVKAKA